MNKKESNFIDLLDEFKEEQIKFNKKMTEQNKRIKKVVLFMMFVCLFVSGITSVLSYTMGANSVEYTPRDSNWKVENTQEAIDDLFNSVGASLVGSVYSYMGVTAPYGYLACDGSTYNIEDYPRLASHINRSFGSYNYFGGDGETTFAVPDLRGEFLRGTGTNSHTNNGNGANVGEHQDATNHFNITNYRNSTIGIYTPYATSTTSSVPLNTDSKPKDSSMGYPDGYHLAWKDIGISTTSNSLGEASNTYTARPTNTSVLYIIKY